MSSTFRPIVLKAALVLILSLISVPTMMLAQEGTGAITGAADAGAQIVLTNLDTHQVIGVMAKCDGTYRATQLKPGRYQIIEGGKNHVARSLSVTAGQDSHVDLAPASSLHKDCTAS
ncbi:carboxypeptidase-like regulatory domain-containing protein [Granulicella arctica]|uniref:carboxypeptidase-like regulatory domain-containing protein n=1 Tax=Granulicella arctica TaxID=940613 RepID=UPI0021E0D1EE|nr:carboxypeptidase-like regulatory domain-containing protein [Granulicella arctica]